MSTTQATNKFHITLPLVTNLVAEQFPQWTHLPINPVELSGIDNQTFRLGTDMCIRLPSAQGYVAQVKKEQTWLPMLAPHLSVPIPLPLAMGKPSKNYPSPWSVYRWIEGESANILNLNKLLLQSLAEALAKFLTQLQQIDTKNAPLPGLHNYWRGAHPSIYDAETRATITKLSYLIDAKKATSVWKKALKSKWNNQSVWVHGDFASGNIILKNQQLVAVIDFGCTAIGDPACDLVIAWTLLNNESRKIFKEQINLDSDTWARARGWALWKANFELATLKDKTNPTAMKQRQIIGEILNEHECES